MRTIHLLLASALATSVGCQLEVGDPGTAAGGDRDGQVNSGAACVFGDAYGFETGGPVRVRQVRRYHRVDDVLPAYPSAEDRLLAQQILAAAARSGGGPASDLEAVFAASEGREVEVSELSVRDGRIYRAVVSYPGGVASGAIFASGGLQVAAVIEAGAITSCAAPATPGVLPTLRCVAAGYDLTLTPRSGTSVQVALLGGDAGALLDGSTYPLRRVSADAFLAYGASSGVVIDITGAAALEAGDDSRLAVSYGGDAFSVSFPVGACVPVR